MMPKGRYKIMTAYMPKVGTLGLDMMYRTCTVQANLDFSSEADMVQEAARVAGAAAGRRPRCSPIRRSPKASRTAFCRSAREIWRDTDNQRAGMLPWAFEDGMGFERYVDYALDVPMYFVKRGDSYIDVVRQVVPRSSSPASSTRCRASAPTISDWANHLSTIFPEVRLKRYLEMRGADGGPWRRLPSLPAFWVGLLYDDDCARRLLGHRQGLDRRGAPEAARRRAEARLQGRRSAAAACSTLAQETLALAARGLARRKRLDRNGRDETRYLRPLQEIVARGITPAEELLEKYSNGDRWNGLGRADLRREIRLI